MHRSIVVGRLAQDLSAFPSVATLDVQVGDLVVVQRSAVAECRHASLVGSSVAKESSTAEAEPLLPSQATV